MKSPTLEELMIKHGVKSKAPTTNLTKAEIILRDVICEYHPDVAGNKQVIAFLKKHVNWLDIEGMVEETMSFVGGYEFVDESHYDFSDGSDCKTASVQPGTIKHYGKDTTGHLCEITGIGNVGDNSQVKSGDLRVVVYNPHKQCLQYYFIPNKDMLRIMRYHSGGYRITTNWNRKWDRNMKLDKFEVDSFVELAQTPATTEFTQQ